MHVEHHFDDLGDNLSGLGVDVALLTADTERTDESDPDSDEEPNSLVHNWFGNQKMQVDNIHDLISATASSQNTEPELLKLTATSRSSHALSAKIQSHWPGIRGQHKDRLHEPRTIRCVVELRSIVAVLHGLVGNLASSCAPKQHLRKRSILKSQKFNKPSESRSY